MSKSKKVSVAVAEVATIDLSAKATPATLIKSLQVCLFWKKMIFTLLCAPLRVIHGISLDVAGSTMYPTRCYGTLSMFPCLQTLYEELCAQDQQGDCTRFDEYTPSLVRMSMLQHNDSVGDQCQWC